MRACAIGHVQPTMRNQISGRTRFWIIMSVHRTKKHLDANCTYKRECIFLTLHRKLTTIIGDRETGIS